MQSVQQHLHSLFTGGCGGCLTLIRAGCILVQEELERLQQSRRIVSWHCFSKIEIIDGMPKVLKMSCEMLTELRPYLRLHTSKFCRTISISKLCTGHAT